MDEILNKTNVSTQGGIENNKIVRIGHVNAQSVKNKYHEIMYILSSLKLDIFCITESCTKSELCFPSPLGYTIHRIDSGQNKRGIMVIMREDIKVIEFDTTHLNQPCNIEGMTEMPDRF